MSRKQQGSDFLTLAILGIVCAAPFVLAALLFILRASALLALFAFPLLILLAYFLSRNSAFPAPPKVASEEQNAEEINLKKAFASADLSYYDRLVQGEKEGLTLTLASGETRFDRRSPRGRQLNRQLNELDERRTNLEMKVADFSTYREHDIAQFKADLRRWSLKASLKYCANVATIVTICSSIVLLAARLANVPILTSMDDLLIWLRSPMNLILPFKAGVAGYLAAMITYPVAKFLHNRRGRLAAQIYEQSLPANDLPDDYQPTLEEFDDPQEENLEFDGHAEFEEEPNVEEWHEILNVSRDATIAEIKSAYRQQLKQNHPDNVAMLGVKIKEAAETQSKRINAAYEEARAQRQF